MAEELDDVIFSNAQGPAEASGDVGSVRQHPLRDLIEVDRYLNSKRASRSSKRGLMLSKLLPPGTA